METSLHRKKMRIVILKIMSATRVHIRLRVAIMSKVLEEEQLNPSLQSGECTRGLRGRRLYEKELSPAEAGAIKGRLAGCQSHVADSQKAAQG